MADPSTAGGIADPERPLRELLATLWQDTEKLVRQEAKLASVELDAKILHVKADLTAAAIGGAVLYAGVLVLSASVVLLLSFIMAAWVAAFLVGALLSVFGFALARKIKNVSGESLIPRRSVRSIRQDIRTVKEAV